MSKVHTEVEEVQSTEGFVPKVLSPKDLATSYASYSDESLLWILFSQVFNSLLTKNRREVYRSYFNLIGIVVLIALVQMTLMGAILHDIPPMEKSSFCVNGTFLYIASLSVLVLQIATQSFPLKCRLDNISMLRKGDQAGKFLLSFQEDDQSVVCYDILSIIKGRNFKFLLDTMYALQILEAISFNVLIIIGAFYVLTTDGSSDIVQAALAVTFIVDVDDLLATGMQQRGYATICKIWRPVEKPAIPEGVHDIENAYQDKPEEATHIKTDLVKIFLVEALKKCAIILVGVIVVSVLRFFHCG